MLSKRIIACLDIKNGRTVKGIQFEGLRDAGDPIELAEKYTQEGVDELVFLDITASSEKRELLCNLIAGIAQKVHIPFTVGGGISTVEDAQKLLLSGADKITVNSAALKNPFLIKELSEKFGKQCIVLAIDAKETNGIWEVYSHGGKLQTGKDLYTWAKEAEKLGAGEILFTAMNSDGEKSGFSIKALGKLKRILSIPVIASGGAGSIIHFEEVFRLANVDAALAASVFHFNEIDIPTLKKELIRKNIAIRP